MASAKVHPKILPVTPENYPPEIPTFETEAEEREFWDTHDGTFYFSHGVEVTDDASDVRPTENPMTLHAPSRWTGEDFGQAITIWLTSDEMDRVDRRAAELRITVDDLLGRWVTQAIEAHEPEGGNAAASASA